jgi:hypothetical protein
MADYQNRKCTHKNSTDRMVSRPSSCRDWTRPPCEPVSSAGSVTVRLLSLQRRLSSARNCDYVPHSIHRKNNDRTSRTPGPAHPGLRTRPSRAPNLALIWPSPVRIRSASPPVVCPHRRPAARSPPPVSLFGPLSLPSFSIAPAAQAPSPPLPFKFCYRNRRGKNGSAATEQLCAASIPINANDL